VYGIDGITARMGEIQATLDALAPRQVSATSSAAFASVLATESARATGGPVQVAGGPDLTGEQYANAEAIVAAGRGMGLSLRDQAIGVMTAMGESSLRVLDYGDKAGPDSRGLFQQRDNGAWGTLADRMDPTRSAQSFFRALAGVAGRDGMTPTAVAHKVQRNADPNHYAKYWDDAVAITARIAGVDPRLIRG
jgi:hypothetical protein